MKTIALFSLVAVFSFNLFGQDPKRNNRFEVELDPIAYALKGYSVHGIFVHRRLRTDLGVFGILQPEGINGHRGFDIKTQGLGLKMNYLLNEGETWYAGTGIGYTSNNIKLIQTNEVHVQKSIGLGVHVGYRWFLFKNNRRFIKGLYLSPWCSFDYNIPLNNVNFQKGDFKSKKISFFPTIHIGYKF